MVKSKSQELQARLQQKEREIYSIQKIGQALSSTLHLDDLLKVIMKEITHLMDADRSTLYLVDHKKKEIWSKIALKAEIKEIRQKMGVGISGYVAASGEKINIPDAYQDSRFDPSTDKRTGYRTRSILCLPIWEPTTTQEQRVILGVIQVLNKNISYFTPEDEGILEAIASEVAIAISNARLYEQLEQKFKEIDLLYEFEQQLSSIYNLSELLQNLLNGTIKYLNCEVTALIYPENNQPQMLIIEKDHGVVKSNLDLSDLEFLETIPPADREFNKESLLRQINEKTNYHFSFLKIIPLHSDQEKFRSAIILVQPLSPETALSDLENSQVLNIIDQKISRAIELLSLRLKLFRQERLSAVGQMMGTIVHDLRSPINSINGFLELMTEAETTPEERLEYSHIMQSEIQSIMNMITEILDFSKGKTSILPRKISAADILKRFQPQIEQLFRNSGIALKVENSSKKLLHADIDKLNRVFYNISKNAKEALKTQGNFYFKIYDGENEVNFELQDDGPGIPEEIRGRLFDSFVTSGKESGTGLGLAIVKKIIDEHHGKIEIFTAKGKGTTFFIKLPELQKDE
jgi:signal transduction histidine kinase/putative methionine-R-sulfoxide reductase with GAF domain